MYDDEGYVEFTHLVGLPHTHVAGQSIAFRGAESGGQISAYLQDSVQAGSRVTVDIGLRVDRYSLLVSETHASPRVNLAFRTGDATVVHASYNHFFVPPPVEGVLSSSAGLTRSIEEIGVALPPVGPIVEDQIEGGVTTRVGPVQLALTSYLRESDDPVHTTIWPDSRIYSYASFDRARAYGLEAKAEVTSWPVSGATGYLNYALGRGHFQNPVTGGFVTEAAHIRDTNRFLAPMDQTHTLTGGVTYRHADSGLWLASAIGTAAAPRWATAEPVTSIRRARRLTRTWNRQAARLACPRISRRAPPRRQSDARHAAARQARAAARRREHHEQHLRDRAGGGVLARAVFNSSSPVTHGKGALLTCY